MWVIRVTLVDGGDVYLRHGATPGEGAIVRFKTKQAALARLDEIRPGLDEADVAAVVPWVKGMC